MDIELNSRLLENITLKILNCTRFKMNKVTPFQTTLYRSLLPWMRRAYHLKKKKTCYVNLLNEVNLLH